MTPMQQILLGVGAKKKTYMDDVFSTYVYAGTGSARSINNGIDLSKGGMVWTKARNQSWNSGLMDSAVGLTKLIQSTTNDAALSKTDEITSFNNNGYSLGSSSGSYTNSTSGNYASWTFRKATGFFDVVTYTGNGSVRTISHSLGCIPGLIMIKCTSDGSTSWRVYHRAIGDGKWLKLDDTDSADTDSSVWNNTDPTSTEFTLGTNGFVNGNNSTFVAYLFAGGESTAATARSVNFDGSSDYLYSASSSDLTMGTGDFTVEGWIKFKTVPTGHAGFYQISSTATGLQSTNYGQTIAVGYSGSNWRFYGANGSTHPAADSVITAGDWYHIAHVRSSGVSKLYVNGLEVKSITDTYDYDGTYLCIGSYYQASFSSNAYISNFRVVKGTAVYTSSFRPPTEPLTNITNTKVLCCNNTSITGKTVGPTLTDYGNVAASTDSPFDDPAAFKFGENEDQGIIKCGSYEGNNADDGTEVFLGWEPSLLLIKSVDTADNWCIFDNLRGMTVDGVNDQALFPNASDAEAAGGYLTPTSTGFKLTTQSDRVNNNSTYIYLAIRRPDGYVGKPAEAGTDVFAMDTGSSSATPTFDSGFPVDFAAFRRPSESEAWYNSSRLTGAHFLRFNTTDVEADNSISTFDSTSGWAMNYASAYQSWQWKRHAGFDVVTYKGNGTAGHQIPHSLSKTPEMIWVKRRDGGQDWMVYHNNLNSGTTPHNWFLKLNATTAESENSNRFGGAPSSVQFTVGTDGDTNGNGDDYIAMLFASVDGISKVGSYTGNGTTGQTITTGFAPRFVIIRLVNITQYWTVLDTLRGWDGTNDVELYINESGTGNTVSTSNPTSNGFTLSSDATGTNGNGGKYIYYAHA